MTNTTPRVRDDIKQHAHTGIYDGGKLRQSSLTNDSGGPLSAADLPHELLSASHSDTVTDPVSRGSVIVGNATPAWGEVVVGAANTLLGSDGTDTSFRLLSALTSAEFLDSAFRVIGSVTATKKLAFEVDGLSVGTRTWTVADLSGTVCLTTGVQTLQSKTLGTSNTVGLYWSGFTLSDPVDFQKTLVFRTDGAGAGASLTVDCRSTADRSLIWSLAGSAGFDLTMAWTGTASRTVTIPDATCTLAGLSVAQTFTAAQTWDNAVAHKFKVDTTESYVGTGLLLDNATGFFAELQVSGAIASDQVYVLPAVGGQMITTNSTSVLTAKTLNGTGNYVRCGTSHTRFARLTSTTTYGLMDLADLTGVRTWLYSDESGRLQIVGNVAVASGANATARAPGKVDPAAAGADFASAQIVTSPKTGFWRLDSYLECTTAGAGSGTMTTTWGWTDDVGATTDATQTVALTATGRAPLATNSRVVYVASGHITIQCLITGAYLLGAQYRLRARATFLG